MICVEIIDTSACGIVWWMQTKYDGKIWWKGALRWDFAPWSSISCPWYGCYTFFACNSAPIRLTFYYSFLMILCSWGAAAKSFLLFECVLCSVPWWLEGASIDLWKRHRRQYASVSFFFQSPSPPARKKNDKRLRHHSFLKLAIDSVKA